MGGFGSGRRGKKRFTGDMLQVDVRRLQREGYLNPHTSYDWQWSSNGKVDASINLLVHVEKITFSYRHRTGTEDWRDVQFDVRLERTPCNYGGSRTWWYCPSCHQRVALLYIGQVPACRHCYQLAYRCEAENLGDRASRQAEKLRGRLGWLPGILNANGTKPKGMHWRTFQRLQRQHDALVQVSIAEMRRKLGAFASVLDELL